MSAASPALWEVAFALVMVAVLIVPPVWFPERTVAMFNRFDPYAAIRDALIWVSQFVLVVVVTVLLAAAYEQGIIGDPSAEASLILVNAWMLAIAAAIVLKVTHALSLIRLDDERNEEPEADPA